MEMIYLKQKLSASELVSIASMLFGMFFGAGNLIFPIALGQYAGRNMWIAFIGLVITAVGIPLLGVAAALADSDIAENWSGKVRFCAVPAEELIEIGFRDTLKEKGIIKYYGGKTEFLYRGYFDGADMAMMVHARACEGFYFNAGSVG